jgi:hypothetical protein
MPHHPPEVQAALQQAEDILISVGALLSRTTEAALEDMVPEADLKLRDAYRLGEALQRWFLLHRAPAPDRYDPRDLPRMLSGTLQLGNLLPPEEGAPTCEGDLAQVVTCLKLLAENVSLEGDGVFRAALQAESPSSVLVTLDGEGRLPEVLVFEGVLSMAWVDFESCWARSTSGGTVGPGGRTAPLGTGGRRAGLPRAARRDGAGVEMRRTAVAALARLARGHGPARTGHGLPRRDAEPVCGDDTPVAVGSGRTPRPLGGLRIRPCSAGA